jgi:YD repeat-containing protein
MRTHHDDSGSNVICTSFAGDGEPNQVTGPDGTVTRWENDRLGRIVKLIENAPRNHHSSSDESSGRVTHYHYAADGGLSRLIVSNPDTGDQVTTWQYGTSIATDGVARTDLLKTKIYPLDVNVIGQVVRQTTYSYDCPSLRSRPAESLRMEHAAIAAKQCQGRVVTSKDANGTEHAYVLDKLDRITQDRVTALGTGIDGAVRRIAVEYTDRGCWGKSPATTTPRSALGSSSIRSP